nr:RHOMBOID-like protein 12, mitochondrial [Ipomoea batatas]
MQRLFSLKGLSKITRNLPNPSETFTLPPHHHLFLTSTPLARAHIHGRPEFEELSWAVFKLTPQKPSLEKCPFEEWPNPNVLLKRKIGSCAFDFLDEISVLTSRRFPIAIPGLTPDGVVIGLILSNVAVFLLWRVADTGFMLRNFTISVDNFKSGRLHTLVTSAFSQADQWHLISNMVGLYFFGSSIGRTFGSEYVLKLYLSGAVLGSVFFLVYHAFIAPSMQAQRSRIPTLDSSRVPGMGASGAVNAIMLLDIFLFPKKTLYFDFIIPVPAILLGIFLIGKDVLRILEGDHRVSGSAHLGGAFAAAIAWAE